MTSQVAERVTINEFEQQIFEVEGFRVFLRPYHPVNPRQLVSKILSYPYQNACPGDWTIQEYVDKRLYINPKRDRWEIHVIDGSGREPRWNTRLRNLRGSYSR
jgi:hypothetical protein